ncbi:MAG: type II toxin-antitoxin system RatA family toxin [Alphaproteobacteria bacterium]|nr:type II toxin-antitoxin system RatA family toxin [Alphaproteobacteria bacterium]
MSVYSETRTLPYSAEYLFGLVAAVDTYPLFLPWILGSTVYNQSPGQFDADLVIGYKFIRHQYTSRVRLFPSDRIEVDHISGPFRYLKNTWTFAPKSSSDAPSRTEISVHIDYEFKNIFLQKALEPVFDHASRQIIGAFERRALLLNLVGTDRR